MVHQSVCKNEYDKSDHEHFIWAVKKNKTILVAQYLEAGINVNATYNGRLPLYVACNKCCPKMVELLLRYGADPSVTHSNGLSPLMIAARRGCAKIIELLLRYNANIDHCKDNISVLMIAVEYRRYDVICVLLDKRAQTDLRDDQGKTVLHRACEMDGKNVQKIISRLIAAGADVNAVTNKRETPLMLAAKRGHLETVKLLVENKANVNIVSDDPNCGTALHCAAAHNYLHTCMYLVKRVTILPNCAGLLPSEIARNNKHDIAEDLMEEEAQRTSKQSRSAMDQHQPDPVVTSNQTVRSSVTDKTDSDDISPARQKQTESTSISPDINRPEDSQNMNRYEGISRSESGVSQRMTSVCYDRTLKESVVGEYDKNASTTVSGVSQQMCKGETSVSEDSTLKESVVGEDITVCTLCQRQNANLFWRSPFRDNERLSEAARPQMSAELQHAGNCPNFLQKELPSLMLYLVKTVKGESHDLKSHMDKKFDNQLECLSCSYSSNAEYNNPILSRNCSIIFENLNLSECFINELYTEGFLTSDEKIIILKEYTRLGMIKQLLSLLDKKGEESIYFFIESLSGESFEINRVLGRELEKDDEHAMQQTD